MGIQRFVPSRRSLGVALALGVGAAVTVRYLQQTEAASSDARQLTLPAVEEHSNQQLVTLLDQTTDDQWATRIRDELLRRARTNPESFTDDLSYMVQAVRHADRTMTRDVALDILAHVRDAVPSAVPENVHRLLNQR